MAERQFLGFEPCDDPDLLVLPVPYERTITGASGTRYAPQAIIEASEQLETFDEITKIELDGRIRQATLRPPLISYALPPKEFVSELSRFVRRNCSGRFVLALGGEHTITYALCTGLVDNCADLTLVWLDAHADFADRLEGQLWSHGTVAKRLWETGASILLIGVRSLSAQEERDISKAERVELFPAHDLEHRRDELFQRLRSIRSKIYISLDVDVFDPSLIPNTGTPQPAGLTWTEVIDFVQSLFQEHQSTVVGADIVEYIPDKSFAGRNAIAAKIAFRLMVNLVDLSRRG